MGLLSSLFGARTKRGHPRNEAEGHTYTGDLDDPHIQDFLRFGNAGPETNSGASVNPKTALRIATAYRCASILTSAVKTVPIDIKRRNGKHRVDASDHAVWSVLRRRPNEWQTPSDFRQFMQLCVLHHGNAFAQIIRGSKKRVIGLRPLRPERMVEIIQNDDMTLSYRYVPKQGGEILFDQADILHLRALSHNGIVGRSVLHYAKEAMGLALSTEEHAARLFKNGTRIGGIFKHPKTLSEPAAKRLKSDLDTYYAGVRNAHKTLVLEEGMDFAPVSMKSTDAQFLQSREFQQIEIAMFYGVPPYLLGLTQKTTSWGSGIEQQGIGFVTYSLQDWLTMWEEALSFALLTNSDDEDVYIRLNPAGLVRGDILTRYTAYATGRQWGWLSINDVRSKEDMDPVEGGDDYLQPLNMAPIGSEAAMGVANPSDGAAQTAQDALAKQGAAMWKAFALARPDGFGADGHPLMQALLPPGAVKKALFEPD